MAFGLGLALLAAALVARADEAPAEVREFLKTWASRMGEIRTLRVEFEQAKTLKILRKPRISKGVSLLKEKRLKMTVLGADGQPDTILATDGDVARIYYPRLKRLEVIAIGGGAPPSAPFPLFGDDVEKLPERYVCTLEREGEDPVLVLIPRDKASRTGEIRMRFRDYEVREVRQSDRDENSVVLKIEKFERNPEVSDADVTLEVPEGTETVYPFGPVPGK